MTTKKVLFISYAFPPQGGVGVHRAVKFLKYLPLYDYESYVLAARKRFHDFKDENLSCQLDASKVHIHKIFSFEPENYRDKFSFKKISFESFANKLTRNFFRFFDFLFTPDEKVFWIIPCVLYGASIVLKHKIDCIYATGDPFSSFLIGYYISKLTKKPLVLDFRDEWISGYLLNQKEKRYKWHAGAEKMMEKKVIEQASKVISVTPAIIENFKAKYPEYTDKFVCIPNGFDEEDFNIDFVGASCQPALTSDKFIILHSGKMYLLRSPVNFLKALKLIEKEDINLFKKIKVVFAGPVEGKVLGEIKKIAADDMVEFTGFLTHKDSLSWQKKADLNLLILDEAVEAKRVYTAKIFEYMASCAPILAIAPRDSDVAALVTQSASGVIIENKDDLTGMKNAVIDFMKAREKDKPLINRNYNFINQFSRKNLTKKLAGVLDEAVEGKKCPIK